jgi:hypothetical protein
VGKRLGIHEHLTAASQLLRTTSAYSFLPQLSGTLYSPNTTHHRKNTPRMKRARLSRHRLDKVIQADLAALMHCLSPQAPDTLSNAPHPYHYFPHVMFQPMKTPTLAE